MTQPAVPESMAARVALAQLVPSALNPRRTFTPAADAELLKSIQANGILTPLLVRHRPGYDPEAPGTYEIVAGHRRYAAALELGLDAVPVTVRELNDDQAREMALIENLQRENLTPLDEAESYQALLAIPGATPASVAATVGKSPAYIGRRLKLLGLIGDAKDALRAGQMDVARAELLVKLDEDTQAQALKEAVWLRLFEGYDPEDGRPKVAPALIDSQASLSELREWVDERTRLSLHDLATDADTRELFPEAAEAVAESETAHAPTPLLEVALDRFSQSPAKATIPAGVLRLGAQFREVVGKRCKSAERAVVVFGQRKGDVVLVCRDKKGCATHWPPKAKADLAAKGTPRMTWQEEQAERQRQEAIFERVAPDLRNAIVVATARVKTTPATLTDLLRKAHHDDAVTEAIKAAGVKVNGETVARIAAIADAFGDLYNAHGAACAIKDLKIPFDLAKAMKAAEAAMSGEAAVTKAAAKAETKKTAPKTAKKGRAA